ncbi:hypothetical protein U9M48_001003, partial [Paspalum notatum var. saurae]
TTLSGLADTPIAFSASLPLRLSCFLRLPCSLRLRRRLRSPALRIDAGPILRGASASASSTPAGDLDSLVPPAAPPKPEPDAGCEPHGRERDSGLTTKPCHTPSSFAVAATPPDRTRVPPSRARSTSLDPSLCSVKPSSSATIWFVERTKMLLVVHLTTDIPPNTLNRAYLFLARHGGMLLVEDIREGDRC